MLVFLKLTVVALCYAFYVSSFEYIGYFHLDLAVSINFTIFAIYVGVQFVGNNSSHCCKYMYPFRSGVVVAFENWGTTLRPKLEIEII